MLEINLLPVREVRKRAEVRQTLVQLGLVMVLTVCALSAVHLAEAEATAALAALESHPSAAQPEVADAIGWARARLRTRSIGGPLDGRPTLP